MVAALYRRYRPESFAEMIGQRQVTEPLMTALRTGRVNHAYLFSGPRGCGKTSSARILARCLNCVEGPTPEPCGKCPSCLELGRDGGGSIDVFEIDAASHGGVEDARELRERAVIAPTRDRFKIFIIDEAHMVTSAGFNALLKVVEEPPENVMFIFATTEPEKVIGTIRSRTHHFPFRLIPPAPMLEYIEEVCAAENVSAQPGVLPLVVRAGGGSARDTMSLLDQLIAGTDGRELQYALATQLLGFTAQGLLNDAIDAFAAGDAAEAFRSVDAVIQSGQDPRRYVEDLLERIRDLIIVRALGESSSSVLRGAAPDDLAQLRGAAARFAPSALSRIADIVNETLTEMSGVTAPRVQLELMVARILVAMRAEFSGVDGDAGAGAVAAGADAAGAVSAGADAASAVSAGADAASAGSASAAQTAGDSRSAGEAIPSPAARDPRSVSGAVPEERRDPATDAAAAWQAVAPATGADGDPRTVSRDLREDHAASGPVSGADGADGATAAGSANVANTAAAGADPASVDLARIRAAWPEVLERIARDGNATSAAIVKLTTPFKYESGEGSGTLGLDVPHQGVKSQLTRGHERRSAPANHLKTALQHVFGFEVMLRFRTGHQSGTPVSAEDAPPSDSDRHRSRSDSQLLGPSASSSSRQPGAGDADPPRADRVPPSDDARPAGSAPPAAVPPGSAPAAAVPAADGPAAAASGAAVRAADTPAAAEPATDPPAAVHPDNPAPGPIADAPAAVPRTAAASGAAARAAAAHPDPPAPGQIADAPAAVPPAADPRAAAGHPDPPAAAGPTADAGPTAVPPAAVPRAAGAPGAAAPGAAARAAAGHPDNPAPGPIADLPAAVPRTAAASGAAARAAAAHPEAPAVDPLAAAGPEAATPQGIPSPTAEPPRSATTREAVPGASASTSRVHADGPAAPTTPTTNERPSSRGGSTHSGARHRTEPSTPAAEAKVATWEVVAIPGAEDGPGSGWDEFATDTTAPTTAGDAIRERVPEVIAAREAVSMNPEPPRDDPTDHRGSDSREKPSAVKPTALPEPPVARHPALVGGAERYGESVVRERLGARFVGEVPIESDSEALDPAEMPPPDDFDAPPPPEED